MQLFQSKNAIEALIKQTLNMKNPIIIYKLHAFDMQTTFILDYNQTNWYF